MPDVRADRTQTGTGAQYHGRYLLVRSGSGGYRQPLLGRQSLFLPRAIWLRHVLFMKGASGLDEVLGRRGGHLGFLFVLLPLDLSRCRMLPYPL